MNRIAELLNATLSSDNNSRKLAEQELTVLAKNPGLAELFLQLLGNESVSPEIRMASALAFKNFVRLNWSDDGDAPLEEEERTRIRNGVLQLLFQMPSSYRRQLSQAACIIGESDFPNKWPSLIEVIRDCMTNSEDFERLIAALSTLDELVKRYRHEMRSNQLYAEILIVVGAVASPMTELYGRLLGYLPEELATDTMPAEQRQLWLELIYSLVRCYHSLVSQDLPEFFEDNLTVWMGGFANLLKANFQSIESSCLDTEPNVLDKVKCSICHIITLYSQRYEECFEQYVKAFIANTWQLLVEIDSRTRFDTLANAALGFLSAICQRKQYAEHFQGENVLPLICENIIIKNLSLREEDFELYQYEPFEFFKRDIEGSDLETRRRGASDFVRALCKFFEPEVFRILSNVITTFLAEYQNDPNNNFAKKDVVFYLVSAIASKSTTERYGATTISILINVSDFYEQFVRLDLLSSDMNALPILKSGALKFLVLFRNQIKPEFILECLCGINEQTQNSIVRLLSSSHVILHHYVAYAIERLLLIKAANGQPLFNSTNLPVKQMIESLFNCLHNEHAYATPHIIKALMRCFTIIDDNAAQSAHLYVHNLEQLIAQAIQNPINPQVVHFVFESLCVLIRKAYTKVGGGLDSHILRIIELIIPRDFIDFVPYALQITALLLDQSKIACEQGRPVAQDQYLTFFPCLLRGDFWTRSANVPALILVLESYISCFPQIILGAEYLTQVMGIYQRLVALKSQDHHGIRLGAALLPYVDSSEFPQLTARELILPLLNRMQTLKTTKFAKLFVLFFFRYSIVKGGSNLAAALEKIQPGVFAMILEKIILIEMKGMPHTTTYEEKRIVSIGTSRLISENLNELGKLYPQLVEAAISILEAFEHRKASGDNNNGTDIIEDQYVEATEQEYSDPYCKLSYAQHIDLVGKDVSNVRRYLAEAVLLNASKMVEYLSANAKNVLNSYVTLNK